MKDYKYPKYYRQYFKLYHKKSWVSPILSDCNFDCLFMWKNKKVGQWRLIRTKKNLKREVEKWCYDQWNESNKLLLTKEFIEERELKRITEEEVFLLLL